jgi:heme exporter protein A
VGILSRGDLPARSLSAGQKRRLSLARLLLADAALWIMDEPVTNLDTAGIALVEELIVEHAGQGGMVIAAAHQRLLDDAACLRRLELTP